MQLIQHKIFYLFIHVFSINAAIFRCRVEKLDTVLWLNWISSKGRLGGAEIKQCEEQKNKVFGINFTPL